MTRRRMGHPSLRPRTWTPRQRRSGRSLPWPAQQSSSSRRSRPHPSGAGQNRRPLRSLDGAPAYCHASNRQRPGECTAKPDGRDQWQSFAEFLITGTRLTSRTEYLFWTATKDHRGARDRAERLRARLPPASRLRCEFNLRRGAAGRTARAGGGLSCTDRGRAHQRGLDDLGVPHRGYRASDRHDPGDGRRCARRFPAAAG